MPIRNLDKIFRPENIAVIGAGLNNAGVGHGVLANLNQGRFAGNVFPVDLKSERLDERQTFHSVGELPEVVDLAVICTPARSVPEIVRQCGEAGIPGLVILSAGFRETGEDGERLELAVGREAAKYDGMRIVGPNCLGVMAPHVSLNASIAGGISAAGHVAFISQSGALCTAVLDRAHQENIGFSNFVSVGNMLDVSIGDLIEYFAADRWTESIILYVQSISQAREFMSAVRAFARQKPIVAYKAGRFAESAQVASSHTGAMAGVDAVYEAAFHRAGIVRLSDSSDMFDCAELLARQKTPKGPRLAIITNAGGPGVMATDALLERQGVLARLADETIKQLAVHLPIAWSGNNPVDVLDDAEPQRLAKTVEIVLADGGVDAVLVIFTPQPMSQPTRAADAVIEVAKVSSKPVLTSWMGGVRMQEGIERFNLAGMPTYAAPEQAVRAFMYLVSYARTREVLYETPRDIPVEFKLNRGKLRGVLDAIMSEGDILSESTSKALLECYGIPVAKTISASSAQDAVFLSRNVGYPVAMKVSSPQITHKIDVGGVVLNLGSDDEVRAAFERIVQTTSELRPDAEVDGVTIQRMVSHPFGRELIVGAKRDPTFGAVLLVGAGGSSAQLLQDRALELPPLSERLARRMLESLRSWPLLQRYRGRPAANIDRLIEVLMRLSYLVADYPEIKELDVNPLLVTPEDAIALDARIILDPDAIRNPVRPYSHLAIRPYPEEYIRAAQFKDGSPILLRPIKPEDEPMWHELLASCSQESIRFRFLYLFKETTHEMATRFCFIDYDREIAIVAEIEDDEGRKLIGVGRLVADADRNNAEYAVLVADAYHGQGVGSLLTDYCLEICRESGMETVVAEMAPTNARMIGMFQRRGFVINRTATSDVVLARKELPQAVPSSG